MLAVAYASTYYSVKPRCITTFFWFIARILYTELALCYCQGITLLQRGYYIWQTFAHIQGVSRLVDITAGSDFLGRCGQKSSYKHVSDFGRVRSYDRLKLRIEGNDY